MGNSEGGGTIATEPGGIIKETTSVFESLHMQGDRCNVVSLEELMQEHEDNIPKLVEKKQ